MLRALADVTGNEEIRHRLAVAGPERAALFSWRQCALSTLRLITETAQG
jgi:hypothetical protein